MRKYLTLLLTSSVVLFSAQKLSADAIVDFTDPGTSLNYERFVLGFDFEVATSISINGLGYFDSYKDGLTESHQVGLWDSNGILLVSATVTNADALEGWFRYATIGSITLGAGTYTVAGVGGYEEYAFNPIGFSTAPDVTYLKAKWEHTDTLVNPTQIDNYTLGFFGANIRLGSSVPEGGMTWLMMAGSLGLLASMRRVLR